MSPDMGGRLFLGVGLDAALRERIGAQLQRQLPEGRLPGRPIAPALWHLTLKFLGQTDDAAALRLTRELATADLGPSFMLGFSTLGAFPRPEAARLLWLGCDAGSGALAALAAAVEAICRSLGFEAETRPFRPHLSLARLQPARDCRALLAALPAFEGRMRVEELRLYRSQLGQAGPRYSVLARWPLAGEPGRSPR